MHRFTIIAKSTLYLMKAESEPLTAGGEMKTKLSKNMQKEIFMATLSLSSGVYRFCVDGTSTALKVNYDLTSSITSAAAAGTTIKTASQNGFRSEFWYWNGSNLATEYGRTIGSRYLSKNSTNKAEISATSATITLEEVDSGTYVGKNAK